MLLRLASLTLFLALPLTACAHAPNGSPASAPVSIAGASTSPGSSTGTPAPVVAGDRTVRLHRDELVNTGGWQLGEASGGDVATTTAIRATGVDFVLTFSGDQVSARGSCNVLRGTYTVSGKRMQFDLAIATRMSCKDDSNLADRSFAELMNQEFKAELLEPQPYRLRLTATNGEVLVFTAKPMGL